MLIGPRIGIDAAAIDMGVNALIVKSDPITFASHDAGWYLVNVNANDVVCMGAEPKWLLVTALLPERSTTPTLVSELTASITSAAQKLGVSVIGGHSEITIGVDRPLLIGTMLGEVAKDRLVDASTTCPGDAILLCKGIAIEGTALLAREAGDRLADRIDDTVLDHAAGFLRSPGISVVPAARALANSGSTIRAMHDPTEGGIASAIRELGMATGMSSEIDLESIFVYPETALICRELSIDPLGLIASGALLAVVPAHDVERAIEASRSADIPCEQIGVFTGPGEDVKAKLDGQVVDLPVFDVDEIARFFAEQR